MRRTYLPWHHHPGHPGVVVPVRIDPTGTWGPTPKAARCGRWRRVGPGWVVPADVDPTSTDQRIVEAAVHLTAYGAVTGWAALHWMGARWFDGGRARPVVLATGDAGIRPAPGLEISEERLLPEHIVVVDGLRVTTPVRSVTFEMRHAPDELAAITALDMACHADLVSLAEVSACAATLGTWTGIPQTRDALPQGDENAWSPAEVAARFVWTRVAGLPLPLTNVPVFDLDGHHLGTPDLLDPLAGVVGEHDGAVHLDRASKDRDVRRDGLYRRLGLEQLRPPLPTSATPTVRSPGWSRPTREPRPARRPVVGGRSTRRRGGPPRGRSPSAGP